VQHVGFIFKVSKIVLAVGHNKRHLRDVNSREQANTVVHRKEGLMPLMDGLDDRVYGGNHPGNRKTFSAEDKTFSSSNSKVTPLVAFTQQLKE
jgi:hypothetical protein